VARRALKKPDEKLAPKIGEKALLNFKGFLEFIGKPFYFVLSRLILFILFIFLIVGRFLRILPQLIFAPFDFILGLLELTFQKAEKLKLPKIKIYIPKPKLPKIKIAFKRQERKAARKSYQKPKTSRIFPYLIKLRPRNAFFALLVFCFIFFFWFTILRDLPSPKDLVNRKQQLSTRIYDRNSVLLYTIYKDQNRSLVSLEDVPTQVRLATLAAEDAEFYQHLGFSPKGIVRSFFKNIQNGELSGGSTITQQLVKNALLTPEKTLSRKIKELILAVEVEFTYSKDQIFEMYLNEVSYGGTAYGIQEASRQYFSKDVSQLTLSEAALLAGLPKSPTKYSPFGTNPSAAFERQKEVLNLMKVNKFISQEEEDAALEQKVSFAANTIDIKAPHFVMYVKQKLVDQYGEEVVEKGGLQVITTLDYKIQQLAEEVVKNEVDKLATLHVGNGAALVINPQTDEILAMVGSKDYFDVNHDGNVNVTTSLRQPGSSIKVVNYAYALSHGYTPATIIDDSPVSFFVPGSPVYTPNNYDGNYRGKITLRSAFAESRNIPAVKVLASYGVSNMVDMGQKMGITSWNEPNRYGLSLTLGGADVTLLDLAKVYATVADYGVNRDYSSILRVTNSSGRIMAENKCVLYPQLYQNLQNTTDNSNVDTKNVISGFSKITCSDKQVLDPRVAFMLIDILKDNSARTPAFGPISALVIPGHPEVAVKTGTSNSLRDNLTVGFSPEYLVAVWVGNNDNSPMSRVASGITGASPIFNKIMSALLADLPSKDWAVPEGIVKLAICSYSGTLPCNGCPQRSEWFLSENQPTAHCSPNQFAQNLSGQNNQTSPDILDNGAYTYQE